MRQLLFLDCCVREEESRTLRLCQCFLEEMKKREPELSVKVHRLHQEKLSPMGRETLERRDRLLSVGDRKNPMFDYAREFAETDMILVGAPYWDLSFPSCLKNYIERVCADGITFTHEGNRLVGLCRASAMFYVSTVGGYVPDGEHMGERYMAQLCKFLGVDSFRACSAQGLDILGADVEGLMNQAEQEVRAAAQT